MPFTLAHPLAVVPLRRLPLPFAALVIGAMSPDFEYFLRLRQDSHVSHSATGIMLFCVPAGLVVLLLWELRLKRFVISLFPAAGHARLGRFAESVPLDPSFLVRSLVAIAIGAATHVIWDSFTHPWGWPVREFDWLRAPFAGQPAYKWLQHGGSLGGVAALGGFAWLRYRALPAGDWESPLTGRQRIGFLLVMAIGSLAAAVVTAGLRFPPLDGVANFKAFVVRALVVGQAAVFWSCALASFWFAHKFPAIGFVSVDGGRQTPRSKR